MMDAWLCLTNGMRYEVLPHGHELGSHFLTGGALMVFGGSAIAADISRRPAYTPPPPPASSGLIISVKIVAYLFPVEHARRLSDSRLSPQGSKWPCAIGILCRSW